MNAIRPLSWWVERLLFAVAFTLGLWALLASAEARFYASLPVPTAAADGAAILPGDDTAAPPSTAADVPSRSPRSPVRPKPGEWVARLEAPSVGLAATVIEGSSDRMLARAAGHVEYTALPGEAGNVGIAGHRDTTFRAVRRLQTGDPLTLRTAKGVFHYKIERTFIVRPTDVYVLDPTDTPSLTLVTCYPFTFIGHAPKRYIVRAVLDENVDKEAVIAPPPS
jgi:sortase A